METNEEKNDKGLFPPLPEEMSNVLDSMMESAEPTDLYTTFLESQCGASDDSQPVEQYDGSLGVTIGFVNGRQRPVGQLQWNNNLASIYDNPGNVSGVRWCTGTLISENLFLTAGHCFDQTGGGWQRPRINGSTDIIPVAEIATNMHVNFNYQVDPDGDLREEEEFAIESLIEYRLGGLDFAIVRLAGSPGGTYGKGVTARNDPAEGDMICIIGHPAGVPKRIEAGPLTSLSGDRIFYNDIDTLGGNSGSAMWHSPSGKIIGVHTNGGCTTASTGANSGMRISRLLEESPTLRSLLTGFNITNGGVGSFAGWAATNGVKILTGDFNGNGRTDIALIRQDGGWATIPIAFSNGNGTYSITNGNVGSFAGWAATNGVRVLTGDFNGNGRTDVALIRQDSGWATVPIAFSNGDGNYTVTNGNVGAFAGWATANGVRVLTGDFNGNGRMDIALVRQDGGWATIPIAFSNGDGNFTIRNGHVGSFANWATANGVQILTGDFNGNGRTDIALVRQDGGWATIPIAFSNGDGNFTIRNGNVGSFANWATASGVRVITGDFNGNGRTDIALVRQKAGWATIPIAFSNGDGTFSITNGNVGPFAGWATTSGVRVLAGDFNGNGRTDIALVRQNGGWATIPVAFSNGDGTFEIRNEYVGSFAGWAATNGVKIITGDFNGDNHTDIALVRQYAGWATIPIAFAI